MQLLRLPAFGALIAAAALAQDSRLYVAASGTGDSHSIQRAIDAAPETGAVISIAPGVYRETLRIDKPNIHLRSAESDPNKTVIVFDKSAGTSGGTLHSATVEVRGDNFTAENLTFANDWNATHPQLPQGSQALALLVTGDRAVFRNMRLLGNQDTLYTGSRCGNANDRPCQPARQYFVDSYIEGNVDFIFGGGKTVFENCEIHSTKHNGGYITAQGKHYAEQDSRLARMAPRRNELSANGVLRRIPLHGAWRPS
jgi:pectin methylesterase-like acyl-CoA thioesterase